MYRDVNALLGDVVKVTPSSKSVGDFALYLITRNMQASDVVPMADSIDFPQSVFELAEGRLGFPHRGFPQDVQSAILKGAPPLPTGERSSSALAPADMAAERERLVQAHGPGYAPTDEDVNASILYPKVFADFLEHRKSHGEAVTHLPTPAFWYGLEVGQTIRLSVPRARAQSEFGIDASAGGDAVGVDGSVPVEITLDRVSPKRVGGTRTLSFRVAGSGGFLSSQAIDVRDVDESTVFSGPMADAGDDSQLASPMPGVVEKIAVAAGQAVGEGDVLMTISAMKMEVHVKAAHAGVVGDVPVAAGDKVVEGALLASIVKE
jgi:pyruvate carboxylase